MKNWKQWLAVLVRPLPAVIWLGALYIILIFALPANKATMQMYNFTSLNYHILLFVISLVPIATWCTAFLSYSSLQQYARTIAKTSDGPSFQQLAQGSKWLAWSLPIAALASLVFNAISNSWPTTHNAIVVFINYLTLIIPLVGFLMIGNAARGLITRAKIELSLASTRMIILIFLATGVVYCLLTFQRFDSHSLNSTHNPYALPVGIAVLTVIIPYLYAWFVGGLAAYEINLYSKHVWGVLYRQALRLVAAGLGLVMASAIVIQFINGVKPDSTFLTLNYYLLFRLSCRVLSAVGFLLMLLGARRLKRIEEV